MVDFPDPGLDAAIAALWDDAQPRAIDRVAEIETAIAALGAGTLDPEAAAAATRDAHKLAGALGTFGMPAGTTHARAIEHALVAGAGPGEAAELSGRVAALRIVVEGGPGTAA